LVEGPEDALSVRAGARGGDNRVHLRQGRHGHVQRATGVRRDDLRGP
jgi:hypothetical protein